MVTLRVMGVDRLGALRRYMRRDKDFNDPLNPRILTEFTRHCHAPVATEEMTATRIRYGIQGQRQEGKGIVISFAADELNPSNFEDVEQGRRIVERWVDENLPMVEIDVIGQADGKGGYLHFHLAANNCVISDATVGNRHYRPGNALAGPVMDIVRLRAGLDKAAEAEGLSQRLATYEKGDRRNVVEQEATRKGVPASQSSNREKIKTAIEESLSQGPTSWDELTYELLTHGVETDLTTTKSGKYKGRRNLKFRIDGAEKWTTAKYLGIERYGVDALERAMSENAAGQELSRGSRAHLRHKPEGPPKPITPLTPDEIQEAADVTAELARQERERLATERATAEEWARLLDEAEKQAAEWKAWVAAEAARNRSPEAPGWLVLDDEGLIDLDSSIAEAAGRASSWEEAYEEVQAWVEHREPEDVGDDTDAKSTDRIVPEWISYAREVDGSSRVDSMMSLMAAMRSGVAMDEAKALIDELKGAGHERPTSEPEVVTVESDTGHDAATDDRGQSAPVEGQRPVSEGQTLAANGHVGARSGFEVAEVECGHGAPTQGQQAVTEGQEQVTSGHVGAPAGPEGETEDAIGQKSATSDHPEPAERFDETTTSPIQREDDKRHERARRIAVQRLLEEPSLSETVGGQRSDEALSEYLARQQRERQIGDHELG